MIHHIFKSHIVVGLGEVGESIMQVLKLDPLNRVWGVDKKDSFDCTLNNADAMHICFPYHKKFVSNLKELFDRYQPNCIIIHSSVPLGTCDELGCVHSPVLGQHPNLLRSLTIFTKYFGGIQAQEASTIFARCNIPTAIVPSARITEAMKLWCTTQFGFYIILEKEIYKWCKENNIPFDYVYNKSNSNYNDGYRQLGNDNYCRPTLEEMPGPIGGHCVVPNLELLGDNRITNFILQINSELEENNATKH